jgi:hypothetical protein
MSGVGVAAAPCTKTRMPLARRRTASSAETARVETSMGGELRMALS